MNINVLSKYIILFLFAVLVVLSVLGSNQPDLCSVVDNAFDGEPDMPIRRPFTISAKEEDRKSVV